MPNKKKPASKKPGSAPSSQVSASVRKVLQKHKELGLALEKLKNSVPDDPHFDK